MRKRPTVPVELGVPVVIEEAEPGVFTILGMAATEGERDAILELAAELAPEAQFVDGIEVTGVFPERVGPFDSARPALGEVAVGGLGLRQGDFLRQRDNAFQQLVESFEPRKIEPR